MPRPNQPRSITGEEQLARRITYERELAGMSYAGLAQRMSDLGCAIDQSALYKIEKGKPRRRITVDELVALAQVFDTPVDDLLLPPELKVAGVARDLWRDVRSSENAALQAMDEHSKAMRRLVEHLTAYPEARALVAEHLESFVPALVVVAESVDKTRAWLADTATTQHKVKGADRGKRRTKA